MPDEPDPPGEGQEQRELLARPHAVVEAKDAEVGLLRAELAAERELRKRLELRVAELQRRLGSSQSRFPPATLSAVTCDRHNRQGDEPYAADARIPVQTCDA